MTGAKGRAVWTLGACQCLYWGVLFYGFSVLLQPLELEFGADRATVAGAFTLGLLVAAVGAPWIGRLLDRGRAATLFRGGALLAVAGLLLGSVATTLLGIYLSWLLVGAAMSALLYESAFGLVLRAFADARDRLRAVAAVTVAGGLASTLFLPALAQAVERLGWRSACALSALAIVAGAIAMERLVLPHLPSMLPGPAGCDPDPTRPPSATVVAPLSLGVLSALTALFATTTVAGMAFSTLLIPMLVEGGRSPTLAAAALGLLGAMQLPGRIWMLRGGGGPNRLLVAPLVLQVAGLAAVASGGPIELVASGCALFGLGAGLHTVARPWLIQSLGGIASAGRWSGRVARYQGLARAAGPFAAAAVAAARGASTVFAGLAVALALLLPVAVALARASSRSGVASLR
jgi:hypothetical protein